MNAAIYARYSSDKQREDSIDAQFTIIERYCASKNYKIVARYADEAVSGTKLTGRDQFKKMLADAQKGAFDVVVFHKVDRAARNELDYYRTKDVLLRAGVQYEYATQNIDSSPSGQLMEGIMVAFAANYSLNLKEETKKGMNQNARNLLFNGGVPPLGYKIVDKKYVINEQEAPIIREIFRMYLAGNGYVKIQDVLNRKGYKTRKGQPFGKNSLHDILKNERYTGTYTFNKIVKSYTGKRNSHAQPRTEPDTDFIRIENAFEAIISKEDFTKVQELMSNKKVSASQGKTANPYLLTGLVMCGCCGAKMIGQTVRQRYRNYICGNRDRKGEHACTLRRIPCDVLENIVVDTIIGKVFAMDLSGIKDELNRLYAEKQGAGKRMQTLTKEKKKLETRLNRLYDILETNGIDDINLNRLDATKANLREIQGLIEQEQDLLDQPVPSYEQLTDMISRYQKMLQNRGDQEQLRLFLLACVEKIEVFDEEIKINLSFDWKDRQRTLVPGTGIEPVRVSLPEGF